ncbi:MAG: ATP-binding cassette domain-containing protein [Solirubrobacteraceae bacterium]
MSLLAFEHVTKRYPDGRRDLLALNDVSFELDDRDFIGVWGMRRSGKSTLLQVAAGIDLPSEGVVRFDGKDLAELSDDARTELLRGRGIGLVHSDRRPDRRQMTVERVATPLLADGLAFGEAKEVAHKMMDLVGVLSCANASTASLSRGESLRVELARALVHEPRVLLVDEPAVLIGHREREEFLQMLRSVKRTCGLALIVVSEEVSVIRVAARAMTIGKGVLRSSDKEGELVQFPGGRASSAQSSTP